MTLDQKKLMLIFDLTESYRRRDCTDRQLCDLIQKAVHAKRETGLYLAPFPKLGEPRWEIEDEGR